MRVVEAIQKDRQYHCSYAVERGEGPPNQPSAAFPFVIDDEMEDVFDEESEDRTDHEDPEELYEREIEVARGNHGSYRMHDLFGRLLGLFHIISFSYDRLTSVLSFDEVRCASTPRFILSYNSKDISKQGEEYGP